MATYANRTCTECGIRKPQPQMHQKEIYVESGKSQTGVSAATWVGVFSGDKRSGKQVRDWMFNNGQRTYKRKKQVWLCGDCAGLRTLDAATNQGMATWKKWFWGVVVLSLLSAVFGEPNTNTTSTNATIQTKP